MCGDSANATDVAALMAGKTAKLCATDPPYLVSYDAKNHPSKNFSDGKNKDWKGRYADKQKSEPLGPFYEAFLRQALAVCEADAAIYVWHASQRQMEVEKAMRDCGILVHQQISWVKNKPVLTHSFDMWRHEPCFFGWKQGNKPKRNSGEFPSTVWQIDVPVLPGVKSRHPTEKASELFTTPILLHTQAGDLCFESFSIESRAMARMRAKHKVISGDNYAMQAAEPTESVTVPLSFDSSPTPIALITQSQTHKNHAAAALNPMRVSG